MVVLIVSTAHYDVNSIPSDLLSLIATPILLLIFIIFLAQITATYGTIYLQLQVEFLPFTLSSYQHYVLNPYFPTSTEEK